MEHERTGRLFRARVGSYGGCRAVGELRLETDRGVFCNSEYKERLVGPRARAPGGFRTAIRGEILHPARLASPARCILVNVGVVCERKRQLISWRWTPSSRPGIGLRVPVCRPGDPGSPYAAAFLERIKPLESEVAPDTLAAVTDELIDCFDRASRGAFSFRRAFGLVVAEALARD